MVYRVPFKRDLSVTIENHNLRVGFAQYKLGYATNYHEGLLFFQLKQRKLS